MQLLKDKNNDTELFSTVYKLQLIDDVIYEVEGETVAYSDDLSSVNTGANASVEEEAEETDAAAVVRGPDFVLNSRLKQLDTPLSKKEYKLYLKNHYFKTISTLDKSKQMKIAKYLETVWPTFKDFDQYVGEGQFVDVEDGKIPMICLLNYRKDTDRPYMVAFKDGLVEEKV